jgi:ribonuclease D
LIQIYDGDNAYVIDPLSIEDMASLKSLLIDPNIEKWVHSGFEDIECLFHMLGCQIVNLWDSQIAASFLLNQSSMGYASLVELELGIQIPKEMTRSNWLQRPLSDLQLQYAVADVYYLWKIVQHWKERNADNRWWSAIQQESSLLSDIKRHRSDPIRDVADMKGVGGMTDPDALSLLVSLVDWRDKHVRQLNKPKKFVASDSLLLEIVKRQVTQIDDLKKLKDMHPAVIRKFGDELIDIIHSFESRTDLPLYLKGVPKNPKLGLCMSIAKERVQELGAGLGLNELTLINRKLLISWIKFKLGWFEALPEIWQPWRRELLLPLLDRVWLNYLKK